MGFDNECILNIQSLAGEYFCPVCRTLIYPHEALQAQCTHLYCKPCLAYVVSSTQACPYDGYLVTEAGSKPLMESNKALAETIGKTTVHCLYHRSGCVWQGPLSDCTTHCSGCAFGNSPVVCNRCGIQIVHRQVQEHAQSCNVNGTNTQPQQGNETTQDAAASGVAAPTDQSKIANQAAAAASLPQTPNAVTGPSNLNQSATANPLPQAIHATAVPTSDQQYYQQYQQYYQQYPGYDPYQQAYQQQYYAYQQQPAQQFQQPPVPVQGQPQPQLQQQVQAPVQLQPQVQTQSQAQGQSHPQTHSQAQPLIPSNGQSQPLYPQAAMVGPSQNQGQVIPQQQVQPQNQPPVAHGHMPPQSYSQVQPHLVQNQAQPHMQVPQYQQPHPQMHHPQPLQVQLQTHPHFQPNPQSQSQPINVQHPPIQPVAGHPPYPSQPHQQIQHAPPQQHPMQVQPSGSLPPGQILPAQFPPPPPHMRPSQPPHMLPSQGQAPGILPAQHINSHNQPGLPAHQRPAMLHAQQPVPPQYIQQPHAGPFAQQHPQARPLGPPPSMQQPSLGFVQPQQGNALPHGMPPQSYVGRPPMLNQGGQAQQFLQSSGAAGVAPHARPPQFGSIQPAVNQSNVIVSHQPHVYPEQQLNQYAPPAGGAAVDRKGDQTIERRIEQEEDMSASLKKSESAANDFGAKYSEVKPEAGRNDEHKPGNGVVDGKDEALTKDAVSELHQIQGVPGDSVTTQRVKEESKDGALDQSPGGILCHNKAEDGGVATVDSMKQGEASVNFQGSQVDNVNSQGRHDKGFGQSLTPQGQIGDVSGGFPSKATEQSSHPASLTEHGRSPHPAPVAYVHSGQQQRPAAPGQPPSHLRPPGHDFLPHGSHPVQASVGEHFLPPGSNQPGPFHPEVPFGGPPVSGSASTWGGGPNNFANNSSRGYEPQSARFSRMSQGEPLGPPPSSASLPHGHDGQTVPHHPGLVESDIFQNQRPPHFDGIRPDSYLDRGPYGQPFGVESSSTRINGAPPPGLDEKFRTPAGMHPDTFPMAPTRHHEQGEFKGTLKQFSGPSHFGREGSPKFGSHSSRPLGGYGMDGPSRFLDKDPHGYGYDAGQRMDPGTGGPPSGFLPPYHSAGGLYPNEPGGRPSMHDDNRGRFDNNRQNPDFLGPMHGFGRHHMDRLPPNSPGNPSRPFGGPHSIDGRDMERHPFGERFPMGPPGHMHRGDFDGPVKPRSGEPFGLRNLSGRGEPGFGSYQDYGRSGESNGPGAFSHQPPFGESFGSKSTRPHLGEPGFRSSYSRKGFPSDAGFYAGGSDSFDHTRKRKPLSMGWCRICKVDCESVEGLDMHGQTREHQRMAMDMVISIKQKNSKKQKVSNDHSSREEATKLRNAEIHAHANVS